MLLVVGESSMRGDFVSARIQGVPAETARLFASLTVFGIASGMLYAGIRQGDTLDQLVLLLLATIGFSSTLFGIGRLRKALRLRRSTFDETDNQYPGR